MKTVYAPNRNEGKYRASILGYTKFAKINRKPQPINAEDKIMLLIKIVNWTGLDTPVKD